MTVRSLAMLLTLPTLVGMTACGGKLIAEQPFVVSGDTVTLAWETTVPAGEASLWLDYALETGSEHDITQGTSDAVYHMKGLLQVTSDGTPVYDGPLYLRSNGPPTDQLTSTVTIGSSQSCSSKGCSIGGRVKALKLDAAAEGSPIVISAALPLEGDQIRIEDLSLQLRSK